MRELTVKIRFLQHCLGNQKLRDGSGRFRFSRSPSGQIVFLSSWHRANMRLAAQLLGRHQDEVDKIQWDIHIEGSLRKDKWHAVYYRSGNSRRLRYSLHEAFFPEQTILINCVVPMAISEQDFWQLMQKAGQYKGLSPWKPGEFGKFEVVKIRPRYAPAEEDDYDTQEPIIEPEPAVEEVLDELQFQEADPLEPLRPPMTPRPRWSRRKERAR